MSLQEGGGSLLLLMDGLGELISENNLLPLKGFLPFLGYERNFCFRYEKNFYKFP